MLRFHRRKEKEREQAIINDAVDYCVEIEDEKEGLQKRQRAYLELVRWLNDENDQLLDELINSEDSRAQQERCIRMFQEIILENEAREPRPEGSRRLLKSAGNS